MSEIPTLTELHRKFTPSLLMMRFGNDVRHQTTATDFIQIENNTISITESSRKNALTICAYVNTSVSRLKLT